MVENFDQKKETRGGRYKNPRVFTEHGVAMLATILNSKVAVETSIRIMDAFVLKKKVIIYFLKDKYSDHEKYKKQYNNIELIINNKFHDRFIILDRNILYHCGSSFKDLGDKCFEISKIIEEDVLNELIKRLEID